LSRRRGLQAAEPGQLRVHQHQVGPLQVIPGEHLLARRCHPHPRDAGNGVHEVPKRLPHDPVVVADQHCGHGSPSRRSGLGRRPAGTRQLALATG